MQQINTSIERATHASPPNVLSVPVRSIGPAAFRALANQLVQPFASFERCAYVAAPSGLVACIGDASIGDGPLNAILGSGRGIEELFQIQRISAIEADLSQARIWDPRSGDTPPQTPIRPSVLTELRHVLRVLQPDRGLSPLLVPLLEGATPSPPLPRLLATAWPGVNALRDWLRADRRGCDSVPDPVLSLIGLGPGLTPSGDDVLGGCLVALHAMRHSAIAARLGETVLRAAHRATSRISQAHLSCAADGYGGAAIHDIVDALLTGKTGKFPAQLATVDRIGHSSGWDALVGVVLGISIGAEDR